jgi:hypothetical protein
MVNDKKALTRPSAHAASTVCTDHLNQKKSHPYPVIIPAGLTRRTGRKYNVINVKEQKCSNMAVDTYIRSKKNLLVPLIAHSDTGQ